MIIYSEIDYDHLKKDRAISEDVNYSPHFHQKYELLYVINIGDLAYFNLGAAKYSVRTGDIILIKPGVLHNLQIPSDTAYDRIVISFSKVDVNSDLHECLNGMQGLYHLMSPSHPLKYIFDLLLYSENMFSEKEFKPYLKDTTNMILAHLKHLSNENESAYLIPDPTIQKIFTYIEEHITEPLNADILSKEFFISKSWLSHNFKKYLNISLKKYINQKKLLHIDRLIAAGIPIMKAVKSCSYTNYTTFFRQYKQYTNSNPLKTKQKNHDRSDADN